MKDGKKKQAKTTVSITRLPARPGPEEIALAVRKAIARAGGLPAAVRPGARVLLKPNLVDLPATRESGAATHPAVCRAVAAAVAARGARPLVAESAGVGADTEAVLNFMGYGALRDEGLAVLDLKKEKVVTVPNPGGRVFPVIRTFAPVLEADALINLPVMKTHDQVEVTLGLKNLKGLLDDQSKKEAHHRGVVAAVVEAAAFFRPCFTLVDGIFGQEGVGPVFGDPVEMDLLVAGTDPVAVDAVAGAIMGYLPSEVPITQRAAEAGLGTADLEEINITGLSIEAVRRRFTRSSEAAVVQGPLPCALVLSPETCTGCRNTVLAVLVELEERGLLSLLQGKTVAAGPVKGKLPAGKPVLVGHCARAAAPHALWIRGCPPENEEIICALTTR